MSNDSSTPLLNIKNLKTYFKTDTGVNKAVDDVSFQLKKGETLGIVGESGSGKSVTCLTAMRLLTNTPGFVAGGDILYQNKKNEQVSLVNCSEAEMRHYRGNEIAMIFQEPMTSLNPILTCGEQLLETILQHQPISKTEAKEQALELFNKVQLPNPERIFNAYPHQLSGGQKQRVMIAMSLSCSPSILIADEPTTALDVTVQKKILQLMNELKEDINAAIIFITHDLGVIAEIADRVAIMYKGKLVEAGTVQDIFSSPQHPYTKSLLACRPPLDYRMKQLPVVSDFMEVSFDTNGNRIISSKANNITDVINKLKVTDQKHDARQQRLQQQAPILKVENLTTRYTTKKNFWGNPSEWIDAVNDVSFEVYPGETLGLVGESGCGKTTLGRTILQLIEPHSGSVYFEGTDLTKCSKKALKKFRKDIQIIFQDPYSSLNPRITIGNAIMEPMRIHNILSNDEERKQRVYELLETVGLEASHFSRYPHEFSGGQRQRICIARTLAVDPKFIICDESVSALDVSVQAQVLNLLIELRQKHQLTLIFISHDLSVVKFMSDRVVVMNKGKIEEVNDAISIYKNPQKKYTQKLIKAIPRGK